MHYWPLPETKRRIPTCFLADRGIFISNDLSRDEIVEEISMRKLSFNDFEELLNLIEVHARNEKVNLNLLITLL